MVDGERTLLPDAVCAQWRERLRDLGDIRLRDAIMAVVATHLPPVSQAALRDSLPLFARDYGPPAGFPLEQLRSHVGALGLPGGYPQRYRTPYPLHAAITRVFPSEPPARRVLVDWFRTSPGDNAQIYYRQLLAVRRCLQLCQPALADVAPKEGARVCWQALNAMTLDAKQQDDARLFFELLQAQRQVGVNQVYQPTGKRPRGPDPELLRAPLLERADRQRGAPPSGGRTAGQDTPGEGDSAQRTLASARYRPRRDARTRRQAEPADPDHPQTWEREQPSALTETDDRFAQRHGPRLAATSVLNTPTDLHRLPTGRVVQALLVLAKDPLDWAYAWLLLTTALPPQRLATLQRAGSAPEGQTPHESAGLLIYRLLDGPVAVGTGANCQVTLRLPAGIAQALADAPHQAPFTGQPGRINRRLRRALDGTPGLLPTADRLRASAELRIEAHARDAVAARALTGRFGLAQNAPAAYRRFVSGELQGLFEAVTDEWAQAVDQRAADDPDLAQRLAALRFESEPSEAMEPVPTGSGRAVPPAAYEPWLRRLRRGADGIGAHLLQLPPNDPRCAEKLLQVVRLHAAYTSLLWLLATGARPIGPRTEWVVAERGVLAAAHPAAYLADKSSGVYRERRVIPVCRPLEQQLQVHERVRTMVVQLLERRGFTVTDQRPTAQQALPAELVRLRRDTLECRLFTQPRLEAALREAGLEPDRQARNAPRHTVATVLRERLAQRQVDAVLGHARAGLGVWAPGSTEGFDAAAVYRAFTELLDAAGATVHEPRGVADVL
ncbi:hypothetical protein CKO15_11075 [Halorhodospira abdelmalekii]|uniref:hypothetical protein n=1 Tax=Halorhodospira abdelmalekii TaxID=421629 RepID=UPI001902C858|nr:hypothetical protein [Halorhodospira abdelmalekii]MBK1735810.1 hypothetical protein [Halorhodospira abdelmalekii]